MRKRLYLMHKMARLEKAVGAVLLPVYLKPEMPPPKCNKALTGL
jgi:hypothetical protein